VADPVVTLPMVLAAGALFEGEVMTIGGGPTPPSDGRWVFPMPAWRGYAPTRSQEYRAPDHHGVDIMYRRRAGGEDAMWPSGVRGTGELARNNGTARWFVPDSINVCAARDGSLWHVGRGSRGWFVVLDHGAPWATFYTHLSSLAEGILETQRGRAGIKVKAGQPLGVCGGDPSDRRKLMHLHFEIWYRGGAAKHIDPWPLLERAPLPTGKALTP
jgi:murein DD-endopeptidase MepM/ murein hydrolase activator NlpD